MSEEQKNKASKKRACRVAAMVSLIAAIALAVVVLCVNVFRTEEQHISRVSTTVVSSLYCRSANPLNPFFSAKNDTSALYEIKTTFKGDQADKILLTYTGDFSSEAEAEAAVADMHADFNTYIGRNTTLDVSSFSPNFVAIGNKGTVNLFFDSSNFTKISAEIVFIEDDDFRDLGSYSSDMLENIYRGRGFTCQYE